MGAENTVRSRGFRPGVALACVLALGAGSLSVALPAFSAEDDRDSVAAQVEASESRIAQLRSSIEGIDATLGKVFLELESLQAAIPGAEKDLAASQERFEAATREHKAALQQLEATQGEMSRLEGEIEQAKAAEVEARAAIGNFARTLYLEGDPSALSVVLTEESSRDISRRMAATEVMTRLQSVALSSALEIQEQTKNQVTRQDAVTQRISGLEEQARTAASQAEAAQLEAEVKLNELTTLKAQADAKKKEWESKKQSAVEQLAKQEAEYEAMKNKLAKIDEENRKKGLSYVGSNGFAYPMRVPMVMTSPFGWRVHPVLGTARLHNGTDFAANCGTPVYSTAPGVVSAVTVEVAGGNVVYVNHGLKNGNSYVSAYVHLEGTNVYPGQSVGTGSVVGWVGATGYATGCHLHFSLMENGVDVDPMNYL